MKLKFKRGKISRAQRTVLYGPEGIGKSTLAAKFPDPLFIDTEGGTDYIDVTKVDPQPKTWEELLDILKEIVADPSVCTSAIKYSHKKLLTYFLNIIKNHAYTII